MKLASTVAVGLALLVGPAAVLADSQSATTQLAGSAIGRHTVTTLPMPAGIFVRSGTYTPSGKVLVRYARDKAVEGREVNLATIDDDGRNFRPFFSGTIPARPKDNGIRFMVFPDNKRIFLGDFVLECPTSLETCKDPGLLPVRYPAEVDSGSHIMHRWSEMIVAPDNKSIAWTTLYNNGRAAVFTAELRKQGAGYIAANPLIVSTLDAFPKDPNHADGVQPQPIRGGEVKQFVRGGAAISVAGGTKRDIADSVVHHLGSGRMEVITQTAGYDETTIFSPDERLGVVMSARFSERSDPAILALMPRPYPDSLNMGLNWAAYTYAVTGVRQARPGNVGPALIEIDRSKSEPSYLGTNLNTDANWVFNSPMSWHPSGKKALWPETRRGGESGSRRLQVLRLPDYQTGPAVPVQPTPNAMPYAVSDLSALTDYASKPINIDVKVYGRASGHITYRRTPAGIEKSYANYSDDRQSVWSGRETMKANPRGNSTYTADLRLTGPKPGVMNLRMTFGPLTGKLPAELIFTPDASGMPLSRGYVEYDGKRLNVQGLTP